MDLSVRLTNFWKIAPNSITICCFYTWKYFYSVSSALLSRCLVLTRLKFKLKLVYVWGYKLGWPPGRTRIPKRRTCFTAVVGIGSTPYPSPISPSCLNAYTSKASTCHPKRGNSKKEDMMVGVETKMPFLFSEKMQKLNHFNEISAKYCFFPRVNRPKNLQFCKKCRENHFRFPKKFIFLQKQQFFTAAPPRMWSFLFSRTLSQIQMIAGQL